MNKKTTSDEVSSDAAACGGSILESKSNEEVVCAARRQAPAGSEEDVEVALSFMWCRFAHEVRANWGPTDIHWAAVQYARNGLRKNIMADIAGTNLDEFFNVTYGNTYEEHWLGTARACSAESRVITLSDINQHWVGPYGEQSEVNDLGMRGAEIIGGQLWYRFVIGVARTSSKPIAPAVITMGRSLSYASVVDNVDQRCVNNGRIDFSRWDWDGVSLCSWLAGQEAVRRAGMGPIDADDFEMAWCKVRDDMADRFPVQGNDDGEPFLTSACG